MRRMIMAGLALALVGCGGGGEGGSDGGTTPTAPVPLDVTGQWTLVTANGQALPAPYGAASSPLQIRSSNFTLRADKTYGRIDVVRDTRSNLDATQLEAGSWSVTGSDVRLAPSSGTAYQMQAATGTLTWNGSLGAWVYRHP